MSGAYGRKNGRRNSIDLDDSEPVMMHKGGVEGFYTYQLNGVDLVTCPFDRSHVMLAKRIQYHLRKCMKQHIGEKVVCPYNATEYVHAQDMEEHLAICESRARILVNKWTSANNRKQNQNVVASPPVDRTVPYDVEEYW